MLTHFIAILCLASVSFSDVPSRLFAVSHLRGMINELQHTLTEFKEIMSQELTNTETLGRNSHKNETTCLEKISQTHNASRKLLNMLVEGEHNGLTTAEDKLENMTLNQISQLWGTLAPGGKSQVKLQNELEKFRKKANAMIIEAIKDCEIFPMPKKNTTQMNQTRTETNRKSAT